MDLNRLRKVNQLQKEITDLERLKEHLYYPVGSPRITSDRFGTNMPSDPTAKALNQIRAVEADIAEIQTKLAEEVSEILDWLYGEVDQPEVRRIIICHYLEGLSWEQTTRNIFGYVGSDTAKKRVYRYLAEQ